jgi:hypothetical protein
MDPVVLGLMLEETKNFIFKAGKRFLLGHLKILTLFVIFIII